MRLKGGGWREAWRLIFWRFHKTFGPWWLTVSDPPGKAGLMLITEGSVSGSRDGVTSRTTSNLPCRVGWRLKVVGVTLWVKGTILPSCVEIIGLGEVRITSKGTTVPSRVTVTKGRGEGVVKKSFLSL